MILVTGSLAYDYLMDLNGYYKDTILPDQIENLSVAMLTENFRKYQGGVAGNIVYNLNLLNSEPLLIATAGNDFEEYLENFKSQGIDTQYITTLEKEITASAFITTDKSSNQITFFHPGAMCKATKMDLAPLKEKIRIAIVGPEIPDVTLHYARECRKNDIPYYFDCGKNIGAYTGDQLREGVTTSKGLFVDEYEWHLFMKISGVDQEELLTLCDSLIITRGAKGSDIYTSDGQSIHIPIVNAEQVCDPTGCGDSYRAGFLTGLVEGKSLEDCGKMGSLAATYCIEQNGTQNHAYTRDEFFARLHS